MSPHHSAVHSPNPEDSNSSLPTYPAIRSSTEAVILYHLLQYHTILGYEALGSVSVDHCRCCGHVSERKLNSFAIDPVSGFGIDSNNLKVWIYYLQNHYGWKEIETRYVEVRSPAGKGFNVLKCTLPLLLDLPEFPKCDVYLNSVRDAIARENGDAHEPLEDEGDDE